MDNRFWDHLDELVRSSTLVIDRPKGSAHPRYPDFIYPADYGYLDGTTAADGSGVDVWVGSLPGRALTGIICTVDLLKRDSEIKLLLGCTPSETETLARHHNAGSQAGLLVLRRH